MGVSCVHVQWHMCISHGRHHINVLYMFCTCIGSSSPGNVEIELQYNDLNPLHPVLLVKLTDVVFFSSKGLSSGKYYLAPSTLHIPVTIGRVLLHQLNCTQHELVYVYADQYICILPKQF